MALTIVVRTGDVATCPRLTFDLPRVVLGRGEGSDVRLPDPSVSHRHATLRQRGHEYILMDEGSTNGTFVGPVRLPPQAPRVVRHGEYIRLGRIWLEVQLSHMPVPSSAARATREVALGLVAHALDASGAETVPSVCLRRAGGDAEGGRRLALRRDRHRYSVGRSPEADLLLDDEDASRRHLELLRDGNRVLVRELGSKNGTLLAGALLEPEAGDVPWRPGAVVEIGSDELRLDDPVFEALRGLEAADDEPLDPAMPIAEPRDSGDAEVSARDGDDRDEGDPSDDAGDLAHGEEPDPVVSASHGPRTPPPRHQVEKEAPDPLVAMLSDDATLPPSPLQEGLPMSASSPAAPIVSVPRREANPAGDEDERPSWSRTDILVGFVAILLLGASVAGILWLLR